MGSFQFDIPICCTRALEVIRRDLGIRDVCIAFDHPFSRCFQIFDRKLSFIGLAAREAYFNRNFCQGHVALRERKSFRVLFFTLSPF